MNGTWQTEEVIRWLRARADQSEIVQIIEETGDEGAEALSERASRECSQGPL